MIHIGTWSTKYCMRTTEKVWRSKMKKKWFAECKKITLDKRASLPSVRRRHLAKGLRWLPAVNGGDPLPSVRRITVGKASFAECYCLLSARHSANHLFAE